MRAQFFAKPFWITLAGLAACFAVSALVFDTQFVLPALILIAAGTFLITLKNLEIGLAIVFAELFANSHGHLMFAHIGGFQIGLRMVIFLAVMLAWLVLVIAGKEKLVYNTPKLKIFIPLFIAVALGLIIGFVQNGAGDAFRDGNAYFYLAYIFPILSIQWTAPKRRMILQVLTASAIYIVILTLGLLYLFSHFLDQEFMANVYRFIRDTRTGEMTQMDSGIFRIFLPAQLTTVIAFLIFTPFFWIKQIDKNAWACTLVTLALLFSVILISLSRSFWVGLLAAALAFVIMLVKFLWPGWPQVGKAIGSHLLSKILAIIILAVAIIFPIPKPTLSFTDLTSLLSSRSSTVSDSAIDSRWKLLDPMLEKIKAAPLMGNGFGQTVVFITDDPRIRAEKPDGVYQTYSLEWGWLELWLKMGILGPLAFLYIFVMLWRGLWPYLASKNAWVGLGFISALTLIYATHIFSPYLNHPLGLGFILFLIPFIQTKKPTVTVGAKIAAKIPKPEPQTTPALTSEN
ncbi:O-antigen ligase family protein [Patescibacteria group bacterium]|nr:O-antigen ligase family protein [Patescibacteria group bacterium]MBU1705403.1 O-antigen ligase family protein [Patescibacteria group bacterium]